MGLCMTRCYTEVRRLSCWKANSGIEDRDRLIDFDMFLDDQPAPRPLSFLSVEHDLQSSDVSLLHDSDEDFDVVFQLGVENEELELQEEAVAADVCKEAAKIKEIAENSTQLINPAKLAMDSAALLKWESFSMDEKEPYDKEKGAEGSSKDKHHASGSSSSSVDLEWENESGLSPVTHLPGPDDLSSDTASCSQLSTPVSNGNEELEWDGHFTSTHISELDMETERLISEIERLTSGALQDQASSR